MKHPKITEISRSKRYIVDGNKKIHSSDLVFVEIDREARPLGLAHVCPGAKVQHYNINVTFSQRELEELGVQDRR